MRHGQIPMLPGFDDMIPMLGEIPVASVLLGPVVGLASARACLSHFRSAVLARVMLF